MSHLFASSKAMTSRWEKRFFFGMSFVAAAIFAAWVYSTTNRTAVEAGEARGDAHAKRPAAAAARPAPPALFPPPTPEELAVPATGTEPDDLGFRDEYTLRVQKTRLQMPGAGTDGGSREVEVLTYNGKLVGPTIRVHRGSTFHINLINDLPVTGEPALTTTQNQEDKPHGFFTTNLHTHGLHVSPSGKADDVFREIAPGQSFRYTFKIPADHPTGTYWYHPHKHGSVAYQMANGLAGALIVEGGPKNQIPSLDDVPEVAAAKERIFIVQQHILRPGPDGVYRVDPTDVYTEVPPEGALLVTTINGQVLPTFELQPGEVQRWRFIHAGREEPVVLQWRFSNGQVMRQFGMRLWEIASDGLATGTMVPWRAFRIYPGNRKDIVIQAPTEPGVHVLSNILEPTFAQEEAGLKGTIQSVARFVVRGPERKMSLPEPDRLAACKPFKNIEDSEIKARRNLVFNYSEKKKEYHVNDVSFSRQTGPVMPVLGTAEEWTLTAKNETALGEEPHPFHIHVNPFQVVQVEEIESGKKTPMSDWMDTIAVEPGKRITIRMRFADFAGKTVLHCHTLDHEDQGMMQTVQIVDPKNPPPADDRTLTDVSKPAPALRLPAAGGGDVDLEAVRGRPVMLVFFRGMGCVHCIEELQKLVRDSRELAGRATIVAVSSEPIDNATEALKFLNPASGLDVKIAIDADGKAFRAFGCYEDGPMHGLFVIDPSGTIRAGYSGETPFADAAKVIERVREIDAKR
jgi:FtsP/CotA-like multicopper oxidase with cupredoxin domain/peroxiredoxin